MSNWWMSSLLRHGKTLSHALKSWAPSIPKTCFRVDDTVNIVTSSGLISELQTCVSLYVILVWITRTVLCIRRFYFPCTFTGFVDMRRWENLSRLSSRVLFRGTILREEKTKKKRKKTTNSQTDLYTASHYKQNWFTSASYLWGLVTLTAEWEWGFNRCFCFPPSSPLLV